MRRAFLADAVTRWIGEDAVFYGAGCLEEPVAWRLAEGLKALAK